MKQQKLDKLKKYTVYLTDEEKAALANVKINCNTFANSVLVSVANQIFDVYEDKSLDDTQRHQSDAGSLIF